MTAHQNGQQIVIVLHGIGHTKWNMGGAVRALRAHGYDTLNITYPSLRHDLDALAQGLRARLDDAAVWDRADRVHFVTHSMGGLVTRRYLDRYAAALPAGKLGRFVMLAPPNAGSEIADMLHDFPPYRWLFGPAGRQLTTAAQSQPAAPPCETGIIAGSTGWPYLLGHIALRGPHDGRVTVARTHLPGSADHITLPATHGLIAWQPRVHAQIVHFLAHGTFDHRNSA